MQCSAIHTQEDIHRTTRTVQLIRWDLREQLYEVRYIWQDPLFRNFVDAHQMNSLLTPVVIFKFPRVFHRIQLLESLIHFL